MVAHGASPCPSAPYTSSFISSVVKDRGVFRYPQAAVDTPLHALFRLLGIHLCKHSLQPADVLTLKSVLQWCRQTHQHLIWIKLFVATCASYPLGSLRLLLRIHLFPLFH